MVAEEPGAEGSLRGPEGDAAEADVGVVLAAPWAALSRDARVVRTAGPRPGDVDDEESPAESSGGPEAEAALLVALRRAARGVRATVCRRGAAPAASSLEVAPAPAPAADTGERVPYCACSWRRRSSL